MLNKTHAKNGLTTPNFFYESVLLPIKYIMLNRKTLTFFTTFSHLMKTLSENAYKKIHKYKMKTLSDNAFILKNIVNRL